VKVRGEVGGLVRVSRIGVAVAIIAVLCTALVPSGLVSAAATPTLITGSVKTFSGTPVSGECVAAEKQPLGAAVAQTRTGPTGAYVLDGLGSGLFYVRFTDCSGNGLASTWYGPQNTRVPVSVSTKTGATTAHVDVLLGPAGSISGHVKNLQTGAPVAGACVVVDNTSQGILARTVTGRAGFYHLSGLPTTSVYVQFMGCRNAALGPAWYSSHGARSSVLVTPGHTVTGVDGALVPGAAVSGRLTDEVTGRPVANVCVQAINATSGHTLGSVTTNARGQWTIFGLSDKEAKLRAYDCHNTGRPLVAWYGGDSQKGAKPVLLWKGAVVSNLQLRVLPASTGAIAGTATAGGKPLGGECVGAVNVPGGHYLAITRTASDGSFTLTRVPQGTVALRYWDCSGNHLAPIWVTGIAVTKGQTTTLPAQALSPGGSISGTVTSKLTGQPINGACVEVFDAQGRPAISTATKADGTYTAHNVPTGQVTVKFVGCAQSAYTTEFYNDRPSGNPDQVQVNSGQTTSQIDAHLVKGAAISGKVTDVKTGNGVAGELVSAVDPTTGAAFGTATTAADGSFSIEGITTSTAKIMVHDATTNPTLGYADTWLGGTDLSSATAVTVTPGVVTQLQSAIAIGPAAALKASVPAGESVGTDQSVKGLQGGATGGIKPYTFSWSVTNNTTGQTDPSLTQPGDGSVSFSAPSASGSISLSLKVTDAEGSSDTGTVVITVGSGSSCSTAFGNVWSDAQNGTQQQMTFNIGSPTTYGSLQVGGSTGSFGTTSGACDPGGSVSFSGATLNLLTAGSNDGSLQATDAAGIVTQNGVCLTQATLSDSSGWTLGTFTPDYPSQPCFGLDGTGSKGQFDSFATNGPNPPNGLQLSNLTLTLGDAGAVLGGSATVGVYPNTLSLTIGAPDTNCPAITDVQNWCANISGPNATYTPNISPSTAALSLAIAPTGTLNASSGALTFDVIGGPQSGSTTIGDWTPGASLDLTPGQVEITDKAPPSVCSANQVGSGDPWIQLTGGGGSWADPTNTFALGTVQLTGGCADLVNDTYNFTVTPTNNSVTLFSLGSDSLSVSNLSLQLDESTAGAGLNNINFKGVVGGSIAGQSLTNSSNLTDSTNVPAGTILGAYSQGEFVFGVQVQVGNFVGSQAGSAAGTLYWASGNINNYDAFQSTFNTFNNNPQVLSLDKGVTFVYQYNLPSDVNTWLQNLGLVQSGGTGNVWMTVSYDGSTFKFQAALASSNGAILYCAEPDSSTNTTPTPGTACSGGQLTSGQNGQPDPNATWVQLTDVYIGFDSSANITLGANALLNMPPAEAGATGSAGQNSQLSLNAQLTFNITEAKLSGYLQSSGTWNDAFGIYGAGGPSDGLNLSNMTIGVGFDFESETPSLSLGATVSQMPTEWANVIGYTNNGPITLQFALDAENPFFDFQIGTASSSSVVLQPLTYFCSAGGTVTPDQTCQQAVQINYAQIYIAPNPVSFGSTNYAPGISLAFDGTILNNTVDFSAVFNDGTLPSLNVNANIGSMPQGWQQGQPLGPIVIGPSGGPNISINNTTLALAVGGVQTQSFALSGGFSIGDPNDTGTSFSLNGSFSLSSAGTMSVSATLDTSALSFISVTGNLNGNFDLSAGTFNLTASGSVTVVGFTFNVNFAMSNSGFQATVSLNWSDDPSGDTSSEDCSLVVVCIYGTAGISGTIGIDASGPNFNLSANYDINICDPLVGTICTEFGPTSIAVGYDSTDGLYLGIDGYNISFCDLFGCSSTSAPPPIRARTLPRSFRLGSWKRWEQLHNPTAIHFYLGAGRERVLATCTFGPRRGMTVGRCASLPSPGPRMSLPKGHHLRVSPKGYVIQTRMA